MKLYYSKPGDSVLSIAQVKQLGVEEIIAINPNIDYGTLQPGTKIMLPTPHGQGMYPSVPTEATYYPGLEEHATVASEVMEVLEMRAFHYHCVQEPVQRLELDEHMDKIRASSNEHGKLKRKPRARTKAFEDDEVQWKEEWVPSVPWINIE